MQYMTGNNNAYQALVWPMLQLQQAHDRQASTMSPWSCQRSLQVTHLDLHRPSVAQSAAAAAVSSDSLRHHITVNVITSQSTSSLGQTRAQNLR